MGTVGLETMTITKKLIFRVLKTIRVFEGDFTKDINRSCAVRNAW